MRTFWIGMMGLACAAPDGSEGVDSASPFDAEDPPSALVINELMADNVSAWAVGGVFPDWIELHNRESRPLNLGGYSLSDAEEGEDVAADAVFGPVSVPAGGFLLVYADGGASGGTPSVGFGLSSGGEALALRDPAGRRLDAVRFGDQTPDVALARQVDGDEDAGWAYVALGTPGSSNAGTP